MAASGLQSIQLSSSLNVRQVIRLGKRQTEGTSVNPRPIKMVLETDLSKVKVLESANKRAVLSQR